MNLYFREGFQGKGFPVILRSDENRYCCALSDTGHYL
jgi:hypothetical protein